MEQSFLYVCLSGQPSVSFSVMTAGLILTKSDVSHHLEVKSNFESSISHKW